MDTRKAQKITRQLHNKTGDAVCVTQDVWTYSTGDTQTSYTIYIAGSPTGIMLRGKSLDEAYVKANTHMEPLSYEENPE